MMTAGPFGRNPACREVFIPDRDHPAAAWRHLAFDRRTTAPPASRSSLASLSGPAEAEPSASTIGDDGGAKAGPAQGLPGRLPTRRHA